MQTWKWTYPQMVLGTWQQAGIFLSITFCCIIQEVVFVKKKSTKQKYVVHWGKQLDDNQRGNPPHLAKTKKKIYNSVPCSDMLIKKTKTNKKRISIWSSVFSWSYPCTALLLCHSPHTPVPREAPSSWSSSACTLWDLTHAQTCHSSLPWPKYLNHSGLCNTSFLTASRDAWPEH